jgi:nicotinic acid mononucleotide adenylyltransferase
MPREEGELELLCAYQFKLDPKKEHTIILKEKAMSVSSTEVRNSINDLNKLKELVPTKVYDYLIDKDLYSND